MDFKFEDLRNVSLETLEPLMAEEAAMWLKRLRWDYRPTQRFLKNYIGTDMLPGLVLLKGDEAIGYTYMVIDGRRAVIGNIYVKKAFWHYGLETNLAQELIVLLQKTQIIERIEAQLLIFSGTNLEKPFREAGFKIYNRNYLSLDVQNWQGDKPKPEGIRLSPWKESMVFEASRIVFNSYQGGIDTEFSTSFGKLDKCEEFVFNLVRRRGCGDFLSGMTTVAIGDDGRIQGVVIATKLAPASGHLPQISVHPAHQSNGVGNYLVQESLRRFQSAGYKAVSLTVTELNQRADSWYRRLGFSPTLEFNAYLWKRK